LKFEERILRSVRQRAGNVVLRAELARMGSASQVSHALKSLQAKGVLVRIGTGVYAKTRKSSVTGATVPAGSLETLATEALKKLGISVRAGKATAAYNSGKTTQIPGSFVVNTGARRISRKIEVGGRALIYENDSRAKIRTDALPRPPKNLDRHGAQDYQSLLMHVEALRLLKQNPALVARALKTLARWRQTADPRSLALLDEWKRILEKRQWHKAVALNERGNQLRQASPLGVLLSKKTRLGIISKVKELKQLERALSGGPSDIVALLGMIEGSDIDFESPNAAGIAGKSADLS
jgi:hypothetical protein